MKCRVLVSVLISLTTLSPPTEGDARPADRTYDFELVNGGAVIAREGPKTMFPTVVRLPDWLPADRRADPKANYYFYFCRHHGKYIYMSWAENITGPWTEFNLGGTYNNRVRRGVFDLQADPLRADCGHVAAPDVHVDDENQQFVMFFHAKTQPETKTKSGRIVPMVHQGFVATSADGLNFFDPNTAGGQPGHGPRSITVEGITRDIWIGGAYQRGFRHRGSWYSIAKRGVISRPRSLDEPWKPNTGDPFGMVWVVEDTPSELWHNEASKAQDRYYSPAATFLASSEFADHPNNPNPGVIIDCKSERMNHLSVLKLPNDRLEIFFRVRMDPDDRFDDIYRVVYDISDPDFRNWKMAEDDSGRKLFEVVVTPEEIMSAVRAAHPVVKPMIHADPVSLGSTGVFHDIDGSKYLLYGYGSEQFGGHEAEGQISAIRLIAR